MQDWLNHKDFKDELANLTEAELKDAFYKELSFGIQLSYERLIMGMQSFY